MFFDLTQLIIQLGRDGSKHVYWAAVRYFHPTCSFPLTVCLHSLCLYTAYHCLIIGRAIKTGSISKTHKNVGTCRRIALHRPRVQQWTNARSGNVLSVKLKSTILILFSFSQFAQVKQLIEDEMKRYKPTKNYLEALSHLPKYNITKFEVGGWWLTNRLFPFTTHL